MVDGDVAVKPLKRATSVWGPMCWLIGPGRSGAGIIIETNYPRLECNPMYAHPSSTGRGMRWGSGVGNCQSLRLHRVHCQIVSIAGSLIFSWFFKGSYEFPRYPHNFECLLIDTEETGCIHHIGTASVIREAACSARTKLLWRLSQLQA